MVFYNFMGFQGAHKLMSSYSVALLNLSIYYAMTLLQIDIIRTSLEERGNFLPSLQERACDSRCQLLEQKKPEKLIFLYQLLP